MHVSGTSDVCAKQPPFELPLECRAVACKHGEAKLMVSGAALRLGCKTFLRTTRNICHQVEIFKKLKKYDYSYRTGFMADKANAVSALFVTLAIASIKRPLAHVHVVHLALAVQHVLEKMTVAHDDDALLRSLCKPLLEFANAP